jgi:hypothetical protein
MDADDLKIISQLEPGIYFKKRLSEEFSKKDSPLIFLLENDLTWRGDKREGSIENRVGVEFEKICAENHIEKVDNTSSWVWLGSDKEKCIAKVNANLEHFELKPESLNLESYLDAGQKVIEELGFHYHRFSTEKVRAYMGVTEDQYKVFGFGELHDLTIGNLAEQAMRELMIEEKKKFISRAFLYHSSEAEQEEKDMKIYFPEEKTLGIRCQREFSGDYLYSSKRVVSQRNKIAEYVVFFNHFGHHIFYVTGIVEKEFLFRKYAGMSVMAKFPFPEKNIEQYFAYKEKNGEQVIDIEKLNENLGKRIGFKKFMKMLSDR